MTDCGLIMQKPVLEGRLASRVCSLPVFGNVVFAKNWFFESYHNFAGLETITIVERCHQIFRLAHFQFVLKVSRRTDFIFLRALQSIFYHIFCSLAPPKVQNFSILLLMNFSSQKTPQYQVFT